MKTELTCISCPLGCAMSAEYETGAGGAVVSGTVKVSGNACPRGALYAVGEVAAPKRTVTTTLKLAGGGTVSVKTSSPVPKPEIFIVLGKLKGVAVASPIHIGQSLIEEVSAGVDMIATEECL